MVVRIRFYRFYLRVLAYLLPVTAFSISGHLWFKDGLWWVHQSDYAVLLLLTSLIWAVWAERYKVTSIEELFRENSGIRGALGACGSTYLINVAILFFWRGMNFSRIFFLISGAILLVLTLFLRLVFRIVVVRHSTGKKPVTVMIVGAGAFALKSARRLETVPFGPCEIAGFVAIPSQSPPPVSDGRAFTLDELSACNLSDIDEFVIACPPSDYARVPQLLSELEQFCKAIRAMVDSDEGLVVRKRVLQFGRLQLLDLGTMPAESLRYLILKRFFDISFSLAVLIVSSPILLVIAAAIKLTSDGPVLFSQERVGLNGKIFKMLKFRSMRTASRAESDTTWTTKDDPRCTPLGILLRKLSLDELPQFWNVLRGDMSVVGPRPERPHFVQKFLRDVAQYNSRHLLKVGITGWAQVNGWRGDTSIQKRVEHDLYYLQNWSMSLDLRIILLTIMSAFISKNAY